MLNACFGSHQFEPLFHNLFEAGKLYFN